MHLTGLDKKCKSIIGVIKFNIIITIICVFNGYVRIARSVGRISLRIHTIMLIYLSY